MTLLTGFLGSGKTTLLAQLLQDPSLADTAVIVNEFGDIGLDHHLLQRLDGETVLLPGGCLCCMARDELAATLRQLLDARAAGRVPPFSRIVIETSGLADPVPILAGPLADAQRAARLADCAVVTTVDAVHGMAQLDEHVESLRQVAVADRIVLTKAELATPGALVRLQARLAQLNPGASVHTVRAGRLPPGVLLDPPSRHVQASTQPMQACGGGCAHAGHGMHDRRLDSHVLVFDEPMDWGVLSHWLGSLAFFHGERLLRIKGLFAVAGEPGPVAVHGVRHLLHAPTALPAWPDADHRSRVVLITCDLGRDAIESTLRRACADAEACLP